MRMRSIALAACLMAIAAAVVWAKTARPLTIEDVAKTWVGYAEDELMFVRLELGTNGYGCCAVAYNPQTILYDVGVMTYRVKQWHLDGSRLTFEVEPASTNAGPIYLKGRASGYTLDLEIGGPKGSWSRKFVVRPEAAFLIPIRDTKEAIKSMAQPQGRG